MNKLECFKIQILKTRNEDKIELENCKPIHQICCERINFFKEPIMIVADPFLFVYNDRLYLFYEQKRLYHPAVIMMTSTSDLVKWTTPKLVLKENFHLSYPWVFEEDAHVYMIPETCEDHSIRLYEAVNSELLEFKLVKKLMADESYENHTMSFSDSSIFKKDGGYYLHTTIGLNGANQLKLYYSNSLYGPYREHPDSPVITSNEYGRNAGCLFEQNGKLFRPAQDCEKRYGDNVHLFKINCLTKEKYEEELFERNLIKTTERFYAQGGHQLNVASFRGDRIIATDAKEYHYYLFNRMMHKLGKYGD